MVAKQNGNSLQPQDMCMEAQWRHGDLCRGDYNSRHGCGIQCPRMCGDSVEWELIATSGYGYEGAVTSAVVMVTVALDVVYSNAVVW